jgi:hypothetical protein
VGGTIFSRTRTRTSLFLTVTLHQDTGGGAEALRPFWSRGPRPSSNEKKGEDFADKRRRKRRKYPLFGFATCAFLQQITGCLVPESFAASCPRVRQLRDPAKGLFCIAAILAALSGRSDSLVRVYGARWKRAVRQSSLEACERVIVVAAVL